MGSCCSIDIIKNKVGHEDTEEPESGCSTPESEMYLERITHIVADIHETVRHKDCSKRMKTPGPGMAMVPPDVASTTISDRSSNFSNSTMSVVSSHNNKGSRSTL